MSRDVGGVYMKSGGARVARAKIAQQNFELIFIFIISRVPADMWHYGGRGLSWYTCTCTIAVIAVCTRYTLLDTALCKNSHVRPWKKIEWLIKVYGTLYTTLYLQKH